MEVFIFILLRLTYAFVAAVCVYVGVTTTNKINKYIHFGFAWASGFWAVCKLFTEDSAPTLIDFTISWTPIFTICVWATYKIIKK